MKTENRWIHPIVSLILISLRHSAAGAPPLIGNPQGEDFLRNPIDGSVALRRLPSHVLPALANSLAISGRLQGGTICFRKRSLHFTISWR
jgi:hypothetical protein